MKDSKLQKILIAVSSLLVLAFIVIKNFDKIPLGKSDSEAEEIELEELIKADQLYGVSSTNPTASKVGDAVLEDGGNAVDAAVAMSFALTLSDPQNSGIGGGGGMLVVGGPEEEQTFYDYYISSGDAEPQTNDIGIPGFLKGLELVSEEKGQKEFSELIQYAIDAGEDGIEVTEDYAEVLASYNYIAEVHPAFEKDGEVVQEGDVVKQVELIETLKKVQEEGANILYDGESEISKNLLDITGISKESLNDYEVYKREPLEIDYRDYQIIAPPAPFSGLTVLQSLLIEEELDLPENDFGDKEYNTDVKDILKYSGRENRKTIGDPNFSEIDYEEKLDPDYLMTNYEDYIQQEDEDYSEPESATTTPFTVIDKEGMMVSATNTLSNYFGSFVVKDGIIYNNAMKNFSSWNNKFDYNKRPKTGIAPLVITNDDYSHKEVLGTSGGARIPDYLFKLVMDSKKNGLSMQETNDAERMYYYRKEMYFEEKAPASEMNRMINYDEDYREFEASHLWGLANGIEIKENNEISGHVDKRGYFDATAIYSDGEKKILKD